MINFPSKKVLFLHPRTYGKGGFDRNNEKNNNTTTVTCIAVNTKDILAGALRDGIRQSAELSGIQVIGMGVEDVSSHGRVFFHRFLVAGSRERGLVVVDVSNDDAHRR